MNLGMETEHVEYKRSTSELREGIESIASILNKHGHGALYFGVRPSDGEVIGQDVSEKTLRDVSRKIGELIEPRIYPQVERLKTPEGKAYIRVEFSGTEAPYACAGRYRIRRADEDIVMSRAKLAEMMRENERRSSPWDNRSSGRTIADIDEDTLHDYVERGIECKRIPFSYTNAEDTLSRLGLLCDDGTLTNAAAVCFSPSKDVMLKMGVFADSKRVRILDNQQMAGTLFSLVSAAELYILNNTRREFVVDGTSLHRREIPEIPTSAVREALFNAFAHRQYEDDSAIQIDIFWDRVDIYSPGLFPMGYEPENYLAGNESASKPRNKLIAAILYRSGDIEVYGTGLQRIKDACDKANVPFSVTQTKHGVHVSFTRSEGIAADNRRQPPTTADNRRQPPTTDWKELPKNDQRVCAFLSMRKQASVTEISESLDIPVRTLRDTMKRLSEKGIVVAAGANRNRTYSLK